MSLQADEALVSGTLVISPETPPFRGGTAHVRLEDISYADAAATIVAESVIPDVNHPQQGRETTVPFELRRGPSSPAIASKNDYAVRAWVEMKRGGTEEEDTLYSEQSYRVLTRGYGNAVTIRLGSH
jgi:uncharacterized lipoprotein YbaY